MKVHYEVEGMDDLQKQLSELVNLAREKQITQTCARFALKEMHEDIKNDAPIAEQSYFRYWRGSAKARRAGNPQNSRKLMIPGTLRQSISLKRVRLSQSVGAGIYVKNKAFYWRFIEFGTPHMAAKPFLRANFDMQKQQAVSRFKSRYKKYVDQIIKRQGVRLDASD